MDTPKQLNDPFVKKDLRMLGLTLLGIAILFAVTAYLNSKTTIIAKISNSIYLATLNTK